jgi:oligoribonuclease
MEMRNSVKTTQSRYLVWFDTEYTTLELDEAQLIQVAMVVTDMQGCRVGGAEQDLVTPVRLMPGVAVSDFVAKECPDLVRHARSDTAPTVEEVDEMLVARLETLLGPVPAKIKDRPILAGNTIHADWWMARRFLPKFLARLHYRNLDVSSLKILWLGGNLGPEFDKENVSLIGAHLSGWEVPAQARRHDAFYDVMASIAELNYYRQHLLLPWDSCFQGVCLNHRPRR